MNDPFFPIVGCLCIYPLILWAIPAYMLGRYRVRLRSPISMEDRREYARPVRPVEKVK